MSAKLLQLKDYLTFHEAAEMLSSLTGEQVTHKLLTEIAPKHLPMYVKPDDLCSYTFLGFRENEAKRLCGDKSITENSLSSRFFSLDPVPRPEVATNTLPYPLTFGNAFPLPAAITENGDYLFFLLWATEDSRPYVFNPKGDQRVQHYLKPRDVEALAALTSTSSKLKDDPDPPSVRATQIQGNHELTIYSTLSDFKSVKRKIESQDHKVSEDQPSLLLIISALSELLKEAKGPRKINQAYIVGELQHRYGHIRGFSKRSLDSAFAKANKIMNDYRKT